MDPLSTVKRPSVIRQEVPDWSEAQRAEPDCCADARAPLNPRVPNSNTHSGVNNKKLDKVLVKHRHLFQKILLQTDSVPFQMDQALRHNVIPNNHSVVLHNKYRTITHMKNRIAN